MSNRRHTTSATVAPSEERRVTLLANAFAGDMSFHEMAKFVATQSWFKDVGFENRVGVGFMGGGMLGVTTTLAHVYDRVGRQVGEAMGVREAEPLVRFLDKKYPKLAPHSCQAVWDADHAAAVASYTTGMNIKPDEAGSQAALALAGGDARAQPQHKLRPEKAALLAHVSDAIGALVRALDCADGEKGGRAFYMTDYFGLRERSAQIKREKAAKAAEGDGPVSAAITSADLKAADKILALEPPIMMLKRVCAQLDELCLVVPYPEDAHLEDEEILKTWRKLYPSRTLVLVPITGKFKITTSFNLLAALTNAVVKGKVVRATGLAEAPRPCLVGVASGGYGVLEQMAELSNDKHSVRLLILHGSGRLADLWAEVWTTRGEETFDPNVAALRLQRAACFPPTIEHVECMRRVLSSGEIILHPITNQSSTLERLCIGLMLGDRLLQLAKTQQAAYEKARRRYMMPRLILRNASILLGLASTIVAIAVPLDLQGVLIYDDLGADDFEESPSWAAPVYYASIILPAVMLVVDQVEAYLGTNKALSACERAAGLVESQAFRYKTHAGPYADSRLAQSAGSQATDLATARQLLLAKKLNAIQLEVAASDAQVDINESKSDAMMLAADVLMGQSTELLQPMVGAKGTSAADELDGDEYLRVRVEPMVAASTHAARMLLMWSLLGRICLFVASAIGTVLATIGESRFVAVTVAFSTSISRWLAATRVEERRAAHMKAASELNCAKLRWEALPAEQRATQDVLDKLVGDAEHFLESTLPPANNDEGNSDGDEGSAKHVAVITESEEVRLEREADLIMEIANAGKFMGTSGVVNIYEGKQQLQDQAFIQEELQKAGKFVGKSGVVNKYDAKIKTEDM